MLHLLGLWPNGGSTNRNNDAFGGEGNSTLYSTGTECALPPKPVRERFALKAQRQPPSIGLKVFLGTRSTVQGTVDT
jgi:hypothetical protein